MESCRREISEIEAQILAGRPDGEGLSRTLAGWSTESRCSKEGPPNEKARRGWCRAGEREVRGDATSRGCKRARHPPVWSIRA